MVMGELMQETELLVVGAGPGGYAAAFRAADLGLEVTLLDAEPRPGGECLFRGCIPSKTLLHLAELMSDAARAKDMGIAFGPPKIDLEGIRSWKAKVIDQLAEGLLTLCEKRGVQLIRGRAVLEGPDRARLSDAELSHIRFRHAILATGSYPAPMPGVSLKPGGRIMDSSGALELDDIPETILILGGGYIALEMGSVYAALGSRVTVAVRSDRLLRGADPDLAAPLIRKLESLFEPVRFNTQPASLKELKSRVEVTWEAEKKKEPFDRVLVAIGRRPNSHDLGLEAAGVQVDKHGFVVKDDRQRTSVEHIYAIGDLAGEPLLAHKAIHEGRVAAEVIAGKPSAFDARAVPAVVYTDPQVAWCGLTEEQARTQKRPVRVERFPWKFSSRAATTGSQQGLSKLISDPETGRLLGVGIVGRSAESLIAEGVLAVEMGALAEDLALSIHPHPTLSETLGEAAEMLSSTATHILPKQRK